MELISLRSGRLVRVEDYISAKTIDLINEGYGEITEEEVREEFDKVINKEPLSEIGKLIKKDIDNLIF